MTVIDSPLKREVDKLAGMDSWRCPKCHVQIHARGAKGVGHRCPAARNQWTQWRKDEH